MEIETLRKSKKKQILIGGICAIAVLSVGVLATSRAKYKLTESINIANGTVNYKVPDFQIIAMYKSDDGTNYTELEGRMPSSGYVINESKSYCNYNGEKDTNAVLKTVDGNHIISNIIKGDKCTIYFDKEKNASETILSGITVNTSTPDFSQVATTDEGVFKVADGMYSGTSYYWRGAVTNNYVKFAGLCWRILRINGDSSIRLIYDGETCHVNGTNTSESIAVTNQAYNSSHDRSEYVGYTYTSGSQRGDSSASNLKTKTEEWYKTNITDKGFDAKVAEGKFCNDRNTASSSTWASQLDSRFDYAARERLYSNKTPTLNCSSSSDIYSLKVGAITADEVSFAGGKWNTENNKYYLYNGRYYWTMSPYSWYYSSVPERYANMFIVHNDGYLYNALVNSTNGNGIRPVINLRSDIIFSSGNGTQFTPYIVAD